MQSLWRVRLRQSEWDVTPRLTSSLGLRPGKLVNYNGDGGLLFPIQLSAIYQATTRLTHTAGIITKSNDWSCIFLFEYKKLFLNSDSRIVTSRKWYPTFMYHTFIYNWIPGSGCRWAGGCGQAGGCGLAGGCGRHRPAAHDCRFTSPPKSVNSDGMSVSVSPCQSPRVAAGGVFVTFVVMMHQCSPSE